MGTKISTLRSRLRPDSIKINLSLVAASREQGGISDAFQFCDSNWHLQLVYSHDINESDCWYSLYLVTDSLKERQVAYSITMTDNNRVHRYKHTHSIRGTDKFSNGKGCGRKEFIKWSLLRTYSESHFYKLSFQCKLVYVYEVLTTTATQTSWKIPDLSEADRHSLLTLSQNLKDMHITGQDTDLKIRVGTEEFGAHFSILRARSPVFAAMLESHMAEINNGLIEIEDCEPEIFKIFLCFLYSAHLDKMSDKQYLAIYEVAHKYDIRDLKTLCAYRIVNDLSVEMLCGDFELVANDGATHRGGSAMDIFISNSENIMATEKWLTFAEKYTAIANEMIKRLLEQVSARQ